MKMEYSTVALHHKALQDFLAGPARLFESLRTALPVVRELRSGYDDARTQPSAQDFPAPSFDPARVEKLFQPPVHPAVIAARAVSSVTHHLRAPDPDACTRPQVNVPARNGRWFLLGALDSATVSNADGTAVAFRRRDPKQFRQQVRRTLELYRHLVSDWSDISRSYRSALPELTSADEWRKVFDES
jgi:galactofuranosylgalactofuranosylrhamnosyl-N-acetylglucosaminyl-diphospho-decaprenol beta-1,5/1,6-galactofuranosyltransferase